MPSPHILIIGGGIGGLALAQGLKKHGISFTLFERDTSPDARNQGYRVRLAGDGRGGADALRECLDEPMWEIFENTCAEMKYTHTRLNAIDGADIPMIPHGGPKKMDSNAQTLGTSAGGMKAPPGVLGAKAYTVDRIILRSLLLLDQESHVKFGKSFEHYELTHNGVKAFFSDGTSEEGTLLVGADGVASLVRKQFLPEQRYVDTGSQVIYGKTIITPELTARFTAEGVTVIQDQRPLTLYLEPIHFPKDASVESNGRMTQSQDYIYWVLGGSAEYFNMPDEEFRALSNTATADLTLKLTENWMPAFRALFELQNIKQTAPLRLVSAKPERPDWTPSTHVTLLGDAAHAMMPAGGSGANAALRDAAVLLGLMLKDGISEKMLGDYIDEMWKEAIPYIKGSAMGAQRLLGFKGFEGLKEIEL